MRAAREEQHRQKEEAHNEALRKEAEEYQKDMDALERVLRMQAGQPQASSERVETQPLPPAATPSGNLPISPSKAVRDGLIHLPLQFSINEVREYLAQHWPSVTRKADSLSPILRRMVDDKIIAVAEKGFGSNPTRYRKISTQPQ